MLPLSNNLLLLFQNQRKDSPWKEEEGRVSLTPAVLPGLSMQWEDGHVCSEKDTQLKRIAGYTRDLLMEITRSNIQ